MNITIHNWGERAGLEVMNGATRMGKYVCGRALCGHRELCIRVGVLGSFQSKNSCGIGCVRCARVGCAHEQILPAWVRVFHAWIRILPAYVLWVPHRYTRATAFMTIHQAFLGNGTVAIDTVVKQLGHERSITYIFDADIIDHPASGCVSQSCSRRLTCRAFHWWSFT